MESGEDKRSFMNFAKSLFDRPEQYEYVAGEPLGIWVEDIVKSDGTDGTQAPFALDQSAERERLNQVLPKFKELCKQQKG